MSLTLKIKRLRSDAKLPECAYRGDAGVDLFSCEKIILKKGERAQVPTGIALEIPHGHVGLVWDKSSVAQKDGLKTLGGVIDGGYRGEIMIGIVNLSGKKYTIEKGRKIAQLIIQKFESARIKEVGALAETHRARRGFGSSGAH
jgi:dUTP pyrophosphatase